MKLDHARQLVRELVPNPHRRWVDDLLATAVHTPTLVEGHYALTRCRDLARTAYHLTDITNTEHAAIILAVALVEEVLALAAGEPRP